MMANPAHQVQDSPEVELQQLNQDITKRLMKLHLAANPGTSVALPNRRTGGLSVRFMGHWRQGVLVTEEIWEPGKINTPVRLNPYWIDLGRQSLHPIQVEGVDKVVDAIVAGGQAYAIGIKGKQVCLLRLGTEKAEVVPPPVVLEAARLGLDGDRLLVMNGPHAWRLEGGAWREIPAFNGYWTGKKPTEFFDEQEPGFPSEHILGRLVFWTFHLEHNNASLPNPSGEKAWAGWFDGLDLHQDLERMLSSHWSIVPAGNGAVWISAGDEQAEHLVRLTPGKACEIAFLFGDPAFTFPKDGLGNEWRPKVTSGAMKVRENGSLLLFGRTGISALAKNEIQPLLCLENTIQSLDLPEAKGKLLWRWDPGRVLEIGSGRYLVGGTWGGVYIFEQRPQRPWTVQCLDDTISAPLRLKLL